MIAIIIILLIVLILTCTCSQSVGDWVHKNSWTYPEWGRPGWYFGYPPTSSPDDPLHDPLEEKAEEKLDDLSSREGSGVGGESFLGSRGAPRTWDFSTDEFHRLGSDKLFRSYEQDLEANVDEAIQESHREYVEDTDFLATTGPSHASDVSHFNPAVSYVGIPRDAMYRQLGSSSTSRTTQSETPEAVLEIKGNRTPYVL